MNWRLLDTQWMNFSKFKSIYIKKISSTSQYVIVAEPDDDEIDFELFKEVFETHDEASNFLNEFMFKK